MIMFKINCVVMLVLFTIIIYCSKSILFNILKHLQLFYNISKISLVMKVLSSTELFLPINIIMIGVKSYDNIH